MVGKMDSSDAGKDLSQVFDDAVPFAERVGAVSLFPAEERIVRGLIAVPPYELAIMTSSDLSNLSGASRSSIDRLSRKLGYPGLKEMRKALLLEGAAREPKAAPSGGQNSGQIADRVMQAIALRAQAFSRSLQTSGDLDALVDHLLNARHICLFGAGESAAVCSAIHLRLVRLGLPVQFSEEHHTQVTLASLMRPGDLAIAISHSGNTQSLLWATGAAKNAGATVAAICGRAPSALHSMADIHISLPTGTGLPGSAEVLGRVVAIGLAEVLFQCIAAARPELSAASVRIDDTFAESRS